MTDQPPKIEITIDRRKALTVEMAASRAGVSPETLSVALSRGHRNEDGTRDRLEHDGMLDKKKKLYLQRNFDAWWKRRPGRDWRAKA